MIYVTNWKLEICLRKVSICPNIELTSKKKCIFSAGLKPQLVGRLAKALKSEENDAVAPMDEDGENTEDNNAIMDGDELDMTDIVVIDEYDSTKPEEPKPVVVSFCIRVIVIGLRK